MSLSQNPGRLGSTASPSAALGVGNDTLDFNVMWVSRPDLSRLSAEVPQRTDKRGRCGCSLCPTRTALVPVWDFHDHMRRLYNPLPSLQPSKRQKRRRQLPISTDPFSSGTRALNSIGAAESQMDIDDSSMNQWVRPDSPGTGGDAHMASVEDEQGEDKEESEEGSEEESEKEGGEQGARSEQQTRLYEQEQEPLSLAGLYDGLDDLPRDAESSPPSPSIRPQTPSPSPLRQHQAQTPSLTSSNRRLQAIAATYFPYPLSPDQLNLFARGSGPNPFPPSDGPTHSSPLNAPKSAVPIMGLILCAIYRVPRLGIELVSRLSDVLSTWLFKLIVSHVERVVRDMWPDKQDEMAEFLRRVNAAAQWLPTGPKRFQTMLGRLGIDETVLVHPVCPNNDCYYPFLNITKKEDFHLLPEACPKCHASLRKGPMRFRQYPRRPLQCEVEAILCIPGTERMIAGSRDRKLEREKGDRGKVYRRQDDGALYQFHDDSDGCLHMTINPAFDCANRNSRMAGPANSVGLLTGQVAELEPEQRISDSCTLLLGITPGPRSPKSHGLWQFMLPFAVELLVGETEGFWCRTDDYPDGRKVKIHLGAFICDRPAAVEFVGHGSYRAHDTQCIRCTVHHDDIGPFDASPKRDSNAHAADICSFTRVLDQALVKDISDWRLEQTSRPADHPGHVNGYPLKRREAVFRRIRKDYDRGWLSAMSVLGPVDLVLHMPFDTMHLVYEGTNKCLWYKCGVSGDYGPIAVRRKEVDKARRAAESGRKAEEKKAEAEAKKAARAKSVRGRTARGKATAERGQRAQREDTVGDLDGQAIAPPDVSSIPSGQSSAPNPDLTYPTGTDLKLADEDLDLVQTLLKRVGLPHGVTRLREWGLGGYTPIAADWRSWSCIFGPLILPLLWQMRISHTPPPPNLEFFTEARLDTFMRLFEITVLGTAYTISAAEVDDLEALIAFWRILVYDLYPGVKEANNFHCIAHIPEDIRNFGPSPCYWAFPSERMNLVVKTAPQGGGDTAESEVTAARYWQRKRGVPAANLKYMREEYGDGEGGDFEDEGEAEWARAQAAALRSAVGEVINSAFKDPAIRPLQKLAIDTHDAESHSISPMSAPSSEAVKIHFRGSRRVEELAHPILLEVRNALAAAGIPTWSLTTGYEPHSDYIDTMVTCYSLLDVGRRRYDVADYHGDIAASDDDGAFFSSPKSFFTVSSGSDIRAGVVIKVFETIRTSVTKTISHDRFALVRDFVPYAGSLYYDYSLRSHLGVKCWRYGDLSACRLVRLDSNDELLASMRTLGTLAVSPQGLPGQPKEVLLSIPRP